MFIFYFYVLIEHTVKLFKCNLGMNEKAKKVVFLQLFFPFYGTCGFFMDFVRLVWQFVFYRDLFLNSVTFCCATNVTVYCGRVC